MRRPLSLTIAAAALAIQSLLLPTPPAGAETVQATDAAGDAPDCKGDVVAADADWTDARLRLHVETVCGMDLRSDPAWVVGVTTAGFLIDINGDQDPDYAAYYDSETPGALINDAGGLVCNGSASHPTPTSYVIELPAGCLPGPFTFIGGMIFDENPYGDTCTCPEDGAPSFGFAGPVHRTSGPTIAHGQGYWMLGRDDAVYAFGDAQVHAGRHLAGRTVDLEPTPSGRGYWVVNDTGQVATHGDAPELGSLPATSLRPSETVTAISRTASGNGYWLFTSLGRTFTFGNAAFFGDMSATRLNGPVLDAIPTPTGNGYYMVGSDGGIFTFGDAVFQGSMGSTPLNAPVQSLVPDPDGVGYWLVASDGGIFAFEAEFYGSMGSTKLNQPVTGMVGFGHGYLMVAEDGGIFTFGDAPFFGSLGDRPPAVPIVSTAILDQ